MGSPEFSYGLNLDHIQFKDVVRFVTKINYSQNKDGCDLWTAGLSDGRYGEFRWKYQSIKAHKFAYALYNSAVPAGLVVRHTCDNTRCVRGDHLVLGTCMDNSRDCVERGRSKKGEKNGRAILTKEIILQAVEDYKIGFSSCDLAKKYNVNRVTLNYALSGKTWAHLNLNFDYKTIANQNIIKGKKC